MIRIVSHTVCLTLVLIVTLVITTVLGIPSIVVRVGLDHGRRILIRVPMLRVNRMLRSIHLSIRVGMRLLLSVVRVRMLLLLLLLLLHVV